jgi:hypothetical protein
MQHQAQTNWCWAAVAASVSEFLDSQSQWTQCTLASQQLNQLPDGCCTDGSDPDTCNQIAYLEVSFLLTKHLGPNRPNPMEAIAPPEVIKREIDGGRPLGVRIAWGKSLDQGHFILITGYDDSPPNELTLLINDPEHPDGSPASRYSYTGLQQGYLSGSGTWTHTYLTS